MRRLLTASALAVFAIASPSTQPLDPITAEDMLKVTTVSVLDLSEDGRRVAVSARRAYDNAETNHRRYGDPTYIAPAMVELRVIDTRTGAAEKVGSGLMNIRQAAWTRDGSRLALLTAAESSAGLPETKLWVYNVDRKTLAEVPRQRGAEVAANSELAWTADGAKLFVALRSPADDAAAQAAFKAILTGPVVVQSSKPFLDWDAMNRSNRRRSLVEIDPATGTATPIVPTAPITNYQLSRDGSFVTWLEDSTEKTSYDVIFGTDNAIRTITRNGQPRTVLDAKTLKTITPRWSDDGRTFAYAEKGEVLVQRIDDAKPRSITPKPKADLSAAAPSGAKPDEESESFGVTSFSRDGSKLLLTSKKGWYVAAVADGARERVLTLDDKNEDRNPKLSVVDWTPAGDALWVQYGEPDKWDRGLSRLDLKTKTLTAVVRDSGVYQGFRTSRDGSTVIFQKSDGTRPAELYAADASSANVRKLTDLNPWIAKKALPASELVLYGDADGKGLYGGLRCRSS